MEPISDQLRRAIDESGKSRYRLAIEAQIDHGTLSRFYNGERGLSFANLERLCGVLGLRLVANAPPTDVTTRRYPKGELSTRTQAKAKTQRKRTKES